MPKRSKTEGDSAVEDSGMEEQNEGGVIDSAKQAAGHLVEQVKEQAASRADQQRHTVASGLTAVADAFRNMGDELRSRGEGRVAEYAAQMGHTASGQVERLAHYLHGRNVRQVASDLEDVARRSPGMFLGGAFVLGLAASRFLKSSRPAPDFIRNMPDPNRGLPPASAR